MEKRGKRNVGRGEVSEGKKCHACTVRSGAERICIPDPIWIKIRKKKASPMVDWK